MTAIWKKSGVDWQENFDRCSFCNRLEEKGMMKDGLCQSCFGEIQELPETVRIDAELNSLMFQDLDDLFELYFQE